MRSEKSKAIKIKKRETELTRNFLIKNNLIRNDLKIYRNDKFIYIPIKEVNKIVNDFEIVDINFEKRKKKINSYKNYLLDLKDLNIKLPKSYDVIGNIILIRLSDELGELQYKIGDSLLKSHKNIKTVCCIKPVSGEFRTRNLTIIAGNNNTKTLHNEFGLKYYLDIDKVYFSPRLANERKRISNFVKKDEVIVDMFAGIGPFSIMIAKYSNPKKIYLVDKNKYAIKYARKNIIINNVLEKIVTLNIDAKYIMRYLKDIMANRIIMNLPFSAFKYFEKALKIAANNVVIHYYDILKNDNIDNRINELRYIAEKNGFNIEHFKINKIKSYSPHEFYMGIDITAKRMPT